MEPLSYVRDVILLCIGIHVSSEMLLCGGVVNFFPWISYYLRFKFVFRRSYCHSPLSPFHALYYDGTAVCLAVIVSLSVDFSILI